MLPISADDARQVVRQEGLLHASNDLVTTSTTRQACLFASRAACFGRRRVLAEHFVIEILDRHDVPPGLVRSSQTFGSYAANVHPHVHALVTDGASTEEGEFLRLPYVDAPLVEEVFRRRS